VTQHLRDHVLVVSEPSSIKAIGHTSPADDELRARLVAECDAYAKENVRKDRPRRYESLDHDVSIWRSAVSRQKPGARAAILSGALVLSVDNHFMRFERLHLRETAGSSAPAVVRPDSLLHAIRPFLPTRNDVEAAFLRSFAAPELRSLGPVLDHVAGDVAAYLATYQDLPEDTAIRLLSNSMLLGKLKEVKTDSQEWAQIIGEAIVEENESLLPRRCHLY